MYDTVTRSVDKTIMPRGGRRIGAGGKPTWRYGKTKVIRVPEALAEKLLEIAKLLDADQPLVDVTSSKDEPVTESKVIDLSGVSIRAFDRGPGVYLADLLRAGYEIRPERIVQSKELRKVAAEGESANSLKQQIGAAIEDLKRLEGVEPLKDG